MLIPVKYHSDIDELKQIEIGDAIDVRCAVDVELQSGEYAQIPLGFSCKLPSGYYALLIPRSSTFRKYGIIQTNSIGLIDESYCGDGDQWAMPVLCVRKEGRKSVIRKNERIAQFVILPKMPKVEFERVETLGTEDRGGFGSTGRM